ncbi:MAG: hypothetical protein JWN68_1318 [Nocardioides sp.]|jgi:hypothetical protein|nr:hypothetical protein [Nocardioides sp.]
MSWRTVALGSFLVLVLVVIAWNAAAFAIESSGLDLGTGSIGLAATSFIATIIWGGLPLLLATVAALVALVAAPRARAAAWVIAVLAAVCGVGLLLVSGLTVRGVQAEQAFAAASLVLGLVLLLPVFVCVRRTRSGRPGTAGVSS